MENEHERRVYYYRANGAPSSVAGIVDEYTDPLYVLVKRRKEGLIKIPRERFESVVDATTTGGAKA